MTRRQAILAFSQFVAASPLLKADRKYSDIDDPLLKQVNVFDFAKLAKAKLDALAWDYLDEGSDDEVSLRANRTHFDDILIRPHFLINDVSSIDTSHAVRKEIDPTNLSFDHGWQELLHSEWRTGDRSGRWNFKLHDDHRGRYQQHPLRWERAEGLVAIHYCCRISHEEPDGRLR